MPKQFLRVTLRQPWDGRPAGSRLDLVRWLAFRLVCRGIAWPLAVFSQRERKP
jgi:hypothetical protein